MKRKHSFLLLLLLFTQMGIGQIPLTMEDSIITYFNEIKTATKLNQQLWKVDLYGPILFVNPSTRVLFTNVPDSLGALTLQGKVYTGILPENVNISNTALNWNGIRWAMFSLPLPEDQFERVNLLAHELFHKQQPSLGFVLSNPENNHLDQKEGRIYFRLEMEALKKALLSKTTAEMKNHLSNAIIFRKYRHLLYPGSDSTENLLELNEGIAEYTGIMMSGRNKEQMVAHLTGNIDLFMSNPTFVRSFAYQTVPGYGYLLSLSNNKWNQTLTCKTNLIDQFIREFGLTIPDDLKNTVSSIASQYNQQTINSEETARAEKIKQVISDYKSKFIELPHLELPLIKMSVSFDPRNLMPLEDKGTVYPNLRITDNWGILTVNNGALMSPNWNTISVSIPLTIEGTIVSGDGWRLELNDGYKVTKDGKSENYQLTHGDSWDDGSVHPIK